LSLSPLPGENNKTQINDTTQRNATTIAEHGRCSAHHMRTMGIDTPQSISIRVLVAGTGVTYKISLHPSELT
jgi:hypothetical protein